MGLVAGRDPLQGVRGISAHETPPPGPFPEDRGGSKSSLKPTDAPSLRTRRTARTRVRGDLASGFTLRTSPTFSSPWAIPGKVSLAL